ncbi:unnamed protein product [Spirodela intermedia]|uniref:Uncharacterized protein n=1 Tax=Spirodela intermedia TaxID=51605 RepID=A0A7I8IDT3_SPIIN|nr:unnamed protein product [Spirodela intermedia]CAA6655819.1 unnamed protein product [Spirodela intermedia]
MVEPHLNPPPPTLTSNRLPF